MNRRNLVVALAVMASSVLVMAGGASVASAANPTCVVKTLPSFVAQGEGEVSATTADIVEVGCDPTVYGTGSTITIEDFQLYARCGRTVTWYEPNPYTVTEGPRITVVLDADGNATVAVIAGPGCQAGETLVSAHMNEEPFETFTAAYSVLPPVTTPPGLTAMEPGGSSSQVEDSFSSGVATIVEAEFENGSEKTVRIGSEELYSRCRIAPHLRWIGIGREETDGPEVTRVPLDNDGNGFVIAIGDASCAPGASLIEGDLEAKPFTTFTTPFTIEAPRPTV
jgi:outer membrane murein-binding lipoprotein Lpp